MKHAMRIFLTILILASFATQPAYAQEHPEEEIVMRFFWGDGCPHCEAQKPYNELLAEQHPYLTIEDYEVYYSPENQRLFQEVAASYGVEARGVPATFIEEAHWSGFGGERTYLEMNETITRLAQNLTTENTSNTIIEIPLIGQVDLSGSSLVFTTILISFIDGFNPCSLWLLTFLLGILILTKSRKKMIIIGGTFLIVTVVAYGAFIAGLFSIFQYTSMIAPIRYIVAAIALVFATVNIKDFFWYKKGISFTISDEHKPGLFKKVRNIMRPDQNLTTMVLATAVLALGVTLIELPCTAGFPVLWSSLVALESPGPVAFLGLLALYLVIYALDEIIVLAAGIITLEKLNFTEMHGRTLKLYGGVIMLFLAIGFVVSYEFLNSITGMIALIGAAFVTSAAIALIHTYATRTEE